MSSRARNSKVKKSTTTKPIMDELKNYTEEEIKTAGEEQKRIITSKGYINLGEEVFPGISRARFSFITYLNTL
jgi:hypothetical protein